MDLRKIIQEILEKGELLSLGFSDDGGVWVCDLMSVPDNDLNLYWISKEDTRHSLAMENHPQVAATISLHDTPAGVQIKGTVEKVKPREEIIKRIKAKQGKTDSMLSEGQALYRLTPTHFEVIYIPLFGLEKKEYRP